MARDDAGFTAFAQARARPLLRSALLLCGDWHLAQDLVQETLARMYVTWSKLDLIDNPEAYAQVVLVRTYLSLRRRRSFFERPVERVADTADRGGDPALRLTLAAALADLSPGDRAVLVLRYVNDRSVEQVAADLGRTATAIRSMSMRALSRLRAVLDPARFDELAPDTWH